MKTLLIGKGYWGNIVKSKLEKLTELVHIADSKSDIDYILNNNDINYVFICSSTISHYDIVAKCIKNNKNIFCEKPFTGSLSKSIELYNMADNNNVNIFVDNIFLYRNELNLLRNKSFEKIEFIWNKYDIKYNESLLDSLMYHDIYMLIEITNNNWNVTYSNINNTTLEVVLSNDNMIAKFNYNRNFNGKEKKVIIDNDLIIDFSNPNNDPLTETIKKIKNKDIDYIYNRNITIETLEIVEKIKNKK